MDNNEQQYKVCVIGVGSIAKRHIRNMAKLSEERGMRFTIDAVRRGGNRDGIEDLPIRNVYRTVEEIGEYDAIFITNPTEVHLTTLDQVRGKARAYFIEKPVTSIKNLRAAEKDPYYAKEFCYVACPLRYCQVIRYLRKHIPEWNICSVRAISSSYLPDWRPGVDYRQTYSARRELGGGVSIDLIHEWDYLKHLFGLPEKVVYYGGKKSTLEIDSDDIAVYLAEYPDMLVELHLDYFGRKAIREILIFTDEDTVRADLIKNQIEFLRTGEVISFDEVRDDYQKRELVHFFKIVDGRKSDGTIKEAVQTMKLTQGLIPKRS